jgi:hypothetical protein
MQFARTDPLRVDTDKVVNVDTSPKTFQFEVCETRTSNVAEICGPSTRSMNVQADILEIAPPDVSGRWTCPEGESGSCRKAHADYAPFQPNDSLTDSED